MAEDTSAGIIGEKHIVNAYGSLIADWEELNNTDLNEETEAGTEAISDRLWQFHFLENFKFQVIVFV